MKCNVKWINTNKHEINEQKQMKKKIENDKQIMLYY